MIRIVTTKEYAMMEHVYANQDGKNKLIVQVHQREKANQIFNTITNLGYSQIFLPRFLLPR